MPAVHHERTPRRGRPRCASYCAVTGRLVRLSPQEGDRSTVRRATSSASCRERKRCEQCQPATVRRKRLSFDRGRMTASHPCRKWTGKSEPSVTPPIADSACFTIFDRACLERDEGSWVATAKFDYFAVHRRASRNLVERRAILMFSVSNFA
jgi:hypothetical protein